MTEIVYCEIDAENRVIIVPQSEKLLGVESDEKGQRKYFKCPKIVGDNIDLSKSTIYINVQNASGVSSGKDRYSVENFKVTEDVATFEWQLKRKVTSYKGTVRFNVCVIENSTQREWNTTYAEGTTLEGLELLTPEEEEETKGSDYIGALTADATATAIDITEGKTAYVDGKKVTGTLPTNIKINKYGMKATKFRTSTFAGINLSFIDIEGKIAPNNDEQQMILSGETDFSVSALASDFGTAKANDVLKGRTFTSTVGLKVEGTLEMSTGKMIKTGSIPGVGANALTIPTGLSIVEKLVLFAQNNPNSSGICSLLYDDGTIYATGVSYSQYLSTIYFSHGTIEVTDGNVVYTPKDGTSTTNTMENVTYSWIAIGS